MRVSKNWVKFNKMFTLSPWEAIDVESVKEQYDMVVAAIGSSGP